MLHSAGKVALAEVGQFVGQDRGKLLFGCRIEEKAPIHAHDTAGYGEGVDGRAVNQNQFQVAVVQRCRWHQAIDNRAQVVINQWVLQLRGGAANGGHNLLANIGFHLSGNQAAATTDAWQV